MGRLGTWLAESGGTGPEVVRYPLMRQSPAQSRVIVVVDQDASGGRVVELPTTPADQMLTVAWSGE